jgi:hypothetical protein
MRAIAGLAPGLPHPFTRNWRTRYRRRPAQNWGIEAGWEAQAVLASQIHALPGGPEVPFPAKRSLEEILGSEEEGDILPSHVEIADAGVPRGYCRRCGLHEEEIAGIPTCPLLARELLRAQRRLLTTWQSAGEIDLYALLDDIDRAQFENLRALGSSGDDEEEHQRLTRRLDRLSAEAHTIQFLVEEGASTTTEGLAHLATLLRRAPRVSREELERHGIVKPWRA